MTIEEIRGKLNSIGNIKVIFEPKIYNETLMPKKELQDILEKSKVSLRGWSFPHIPTEDREDGKRPYSLGNGVEFYTSWQGIIEVSRFYQSGQFLSKFALREDTLGELYGKPLEVGKYLDFLGLIYKVTLKKDAVHILMTLTTIGCPLFSQIEMEMKQKLTELGFKDENIKLELTFDPPWSLERMSERGKALMGI